MQIGLDLLINKEVRAVYRILQISLGVERVQGSGFFGVTKERVCLETIKITPDISSLSCDEEVLREIVKDVKIPYECIDAMTRSYPTNYFINILNIICAAYSLELVETFRKGDWTHQVPWAQFLLKDKDETNVSSLMPGKQN